MNKQKYFLRILSMCIAIVMMLACFLNVLVACNDGNSGNGDTSDIDEDTGNDETPVNYSLLADYDTETLTTFKNLVSDCVGYVATNYSRCESNIEIISTHAVRVGWSETLCAATIFAYIDENVKEDWKIKISIYKTVENATYAFRQLGGARIKMQSGKIVIDGADEEKIEQMKGASIPSQLITDDKMSFINDAIKLAEDPDTPCKNLTLRLTTYNDYKSLNEMEAHMSLEYFSFHSNCTETYSVVPKSVYSIFPYDHIYNFDTRRENFTDDSYLKLENDTYFYYTKQKIGFTFKEFDTAYQLVKYYYEGDSLTDIEIPSEYKGKPVVKISDTAFYDCIYIKSVIIPDSIAHIGLDAFSSCTTLSSIIIPATVSRIDNHAFVNCTNLKTIYCEAENDDDWDPSWDYIGYNYDVEIVWGYKG